MKLGTIVEDETHLIQTWISGSDGRYTENDKFNGDILEGFSPRRFKTSPDQ
jgi:hypothetical protein